MYHTYQYLFYINTPFYTQWENEWEFENARKGEERMFLKGNNF